MVIKGFDSSFDWFPNTISRIEQCTRNLPSSCFAYSIVEVIGRSDAVVLVRFSCGGGD